MQIGLDSELQAHAHVPLMSHTLLNYSQNIAPAKRHLRDAGSGRQLQGQLEGLSGRLSSLGCWKMARHVWKLPRSRASRCLHRRAVHA